MQILKLNVILVLAALLCLGRTALPAAADGLLVLYLPFDEAVDSTTFADASGNGHVGSCPGGCPTAGISGQVGTALYFDGTNDYVEVPYDAAFNPNGSFTVAAWVKLDGGSSFRTVLASRGGSPTRGYNLYATENDVWQFWLNNGNSDWHMVGTEPVVYNIWTHVAGVYDRTTFTIQVYVNGQPAGSQSGVTFAPNAQYPLRVGAGTTEQSPLFFFPGSIDDVRVYNGALTQAEIQDIASPSVHAVDDVYTTRENIPLSVDAPGVLGNDVSTAGTLTATVKTPPAHGDLALDLDGAFIYTPTSGYTGTVTFTYLAGARTLTDTATVTLTVEPNVAPVAADDSYTTDELTPLTVPAPGVLENDSDANGDAITATLTTTPAQGTLALELDGSFVYTPALGFPGEYTFQYETSDGLLTDSATVTLTVEANLAPTAQDDAYTAYRNTPLTVDAPGLLTNDSDPHGHALTATLLTTPTHGTVVVQLDGSFTYTPAIDYLGTDTFRYTASDTVLTDTATVTLTVAPLPCQVDTDDDGVTNYASADAGAVQQAVDAASPGDLIRIAGTCAGVQNRNTWYSQTVYISQSLTLQGGYSLDDWSLDPDPDLYPTTLDAQRLGRVLYISGTVTVTLDGLVITRGFAEDDGGGGVYTQGTLTVTQSTFEDNESGGGGAIYGADATLSIAESTFTGNHAYNGGGIYVWGESLTISDTLFHTNTADYDGGALYSENNVLTLDSVTLRDNEGGENGGAISAVNSGDGTLFATRSTFQENRASSLGGAIYNQGAPMTVTHSVFYTNTTGYGHGGAIYALTVPTLLDDLVFSGNATLVESNGGAIYAQNGTLLVNDTTFRLNRTEFSGGAIYADHNPLTVTYSLFYTNTSDSGGGAIYTYYSDSGIAHSAFYGNTAVSGGGALRAGNNTVLLNDVLMERNTASKGGGIHLWVATLDVTSSTFRLNRAGSGGAIYADYRPITITHTAFYTNTATSGSGGAIYTFISSDVLLDDVVLRSNTANKFGGGLYVYHGTRLEVTGSTFQQNSTILENGGGLYADILTSGVVVTNTSFFTNTAGFYGGGMYHHASAVLSDLIFSGNSAIYGGGLVNDGSSYGIISPALTNVTFNSNRAFSRGGGLYNNGSDWGSCTPTLTDVIFRDNAAYSGGAIYFYGWGRGSVGGTITNGLFDSNGNDHIGYDDGDATAQPHFINSSFTGAISRTATIESFDDGQRPISFTNSILWGNGGDLTNDDAAVNVTHSVVEEAAYASGTGNVHADPLFVDAAGGDLRLRYGSPAIDAGDDGALPPAVTTDLDGLPRLSGPHIDMGAYEFQQDVLALAKFVNPTTIAPHDTVTYTLVLDNMRAVDETAVVLTDTLPAGVDFGGWISAPAGTLQAGNTLTWTGALSSAAQHTFVFTATHTGDRGDVLTNTAHFSGSLQQGSAWATFTVVTNQAPVLDPIGDRTVAEGAILTFTVSASDPDGTTPTLGAEHLPAGAAFTPTTGLFAWTPGFDAAGAYTATFFATDGVLTATETVTLTVTDTNRPPVAVAGPDREVAPGSTLTLDGSGSYDPDGEPLTYLWIRVGDPAFTSPLSVTTYTLPTGSGVFTFTLTVSDTHGLSDSDLVVVRTVDYHVYLPLVCRSRD